MAKKKASKTIVAKRTIDFEHEFPGVRFACATVGPQGEPILLSLEDDPDDRVVAKSGASFPKFISDRPNRYGIRHRVDGEWPEIPLPPTRENFSEFQPLPGDRWLAVRPRARGDDDRNAHAFDANGQLLNSFHAGDGIQDLQTDEAGGIWISYFDEGVFGNTSLGTKGLVCLDDEGELRFDFAAQSHECVRLMADCYALNVVSSREIWLRYYTDFPLVQIVDGKIADVRYKLPAQGASAFAVHGRRALFEGGYDRRGELVLVDLDTRRGERLIPVDESGDRLRDWFARGRGSILYLVADDSLFEIDAAQIE